MTNNIHPNTNILYHNIATRHTNYLISHPDTTDSLLDLIDFYTLDTLLNVIERPINIFYFFSIIHNVHTKLVDILLDEPEHPFYNELSDYFNFLTTDLILEDFYK